MYWILFVMATLVSLVLAVVVGGLATPRKHIATRVITLKAPPETVFAIIHDVASYPDWRDDIHSVHVDVRNDATMRWTEVGTNGSVTYEATSDHPPFHFTARIADQDLNYSGEWRYTLTPAGTGTRVSIAEHGEVGNPIFRFIGTHIMGFTRSIDAYLRNLALQLGERATPQADVA